MGLNRHSGEVPGVPALTRHRYSEESFQGVCTCGTIPVLQSSRCSGGTKCSSKGACGGKLSAATAS
eukprot:9637818-Alexandrium_andersonii.AAC.1